MPKTAHDTHPQDKEIVYARYNQTLIGELRIRYGADFAKGCADHETLIDVLRKLPTLRSVIRDQEARRFEQI
jgi:hypothetical protein